jgi:hypothetical protein
MRTLPPSAAEINEVGTFERDLRERGERDARLENLANVRRRTTLRLAGLELPDCFAAATVSAAVNSLDRETVSARAARRRLAGKAYRLASTG